MGHSQALELGRKMSQGLGAFQPGESAKEWRDGGWGQGSAVELEAEAWSEFGFRIWGLASGTGGKIGTEDERRVPEFGAGVR